MGQHSKGVTVVVACRVMEPELQRVVDGNRRIEIRYLDQGLHRTPKKMAPVIQAEIDEAARYAGRIVLGYGLCSNGIVGVLSRDQGLMVPACHDCIAFFLGSHQAYLQVFGTKPGTYYLTPGWIAEKKDPLGIVEEYTLRYGRETAVWVMQEELKHYTHIAFINTGVGDTHKLRERTLENVRFFEKAYEEIPGSLAYFKKLIHGPYKKEDFFRLRPKSAVTQEMFLNEE